jgi:hypothetical protein
MSAKRPSPTSHSPAKRVSLTTTIPGVVIDAGNNIKNHLWDANCPFASLYIWLMAATSLYYLVGLADNQVYLDKDGVTIRVEKVTRTLRWWLFTSALAMTVLGYYAIKKGCSSAGSGWAGLWFVGSMILARVVFVLILASKENTVACKIPA